MNLIPKTIAFFDTHHFEKETFLNANLRFGFEIDFIEARLNSKTVRLAAGADAVCSFVNDKVDANCLRLMKEQGTRLLALRSAGFNHVDLQAAKTEQIIVARVPGYSPYSVAEFAVGLLLTLNRKIHRAYWRNRELNFSLDGLVGFDLHGKTVGVVGTGRIGQIFAEIMLAFGCRVLAFDQKPNPDLTARAGFRYTDLNSLLRESDILSLHVPLTPATRHLIGREAISTMKTGAFIINTGRGALVDAKELIEGLKSEKIGGAALDVYEEEEDIFFHDLSDKILQDDIFARLLTFPNVLVTSHQAFLTREALTEIAEITLASVDEYLRLGAPAAGKIVVGL